MKLVFVYLLFHQPFSIPAATDSSSGPQTQVPVTSPGPGASPDTGEKCESASQKVSVTRAAETVGEEENDFTRN